MNRMVAALLVFVPSLALAAPNKLLPGSEHAPPLVLDETSVTMYAHPFPEDSKKGYVIQAYVGILGFADASDRARIDLKKNGKVFATMKCQLKVDDSYAHGDCEYKDKPLTPTGEIEGELIYTDDHTEKDYLVRTFKVTVLHIGGQANGSYDVWSIVPDDLLAAGWMVLGYEDVNDSRRRHPELYFWAASTEGLSNPVLRCTVGSKKLADIKLSESGSDSQQITIDNQPKSGARKQVTWRRVPLMPDVYWGKRDTLNPKIEADRALVDNPGKWECGLRREGKTLRQLSFTVNADGMVEQAEMQSGKNPVPVFSDRVVLIDMRLGKDAATYDQRINPDAMRKSMGFGLPWPDHPQVKAIHASFPPKSGIAFP